MKWINFIHLYQPANTKDCYIKEAVENNVKVKITYYQNHEYKEVNTYIKEYDTYQKKLMLKGESPKEVNFVDIIDISLIS